MKMSAPLLTWNQESVREAEAEAKRSEVGNLGGMIRDWPG